jgi:hypothetical protein
MDVPLFSIAYVIENEEKKTKIALSYFSCSDNSWIQLFRASISLLSYPGVCAVECIPTAKAPQRSIYLFFFVA